MTTFCPHQRPSASFHLTDQISNLHSSLLSQTLTRTSRNQNGERGRCRMRRVEAANPSLTVGAPSLAPEFSATFGANFMMFGTEGG